jgi:glycolate oxidase iron-sulfur subunit
MSVKGSGVTGETKLAGALAREEGKLLACIHCGLCLEACPTYVHTGDENDGPRGRIYLMRAAEEGRISAGSRSFERHINRCLGCRACESACPAGVEYGQLLEAARFDLRRAGRRRSHTDRLLHFALRHVWTHPARLRLAFAAARLLRDAGLARLLLWTRLPRLVSPRAEFALALLAASAPALPEADVKSPAHAAPAGRESGNGSRGPGGHTSDAAAGESKSAGRAQLFRGCVGEGLFARVNRATERVLAANGCAVESPAGQVCCGALHAHAGDLEGARRLARRNVEAFAAASEDGSAVVTNAGGCGAMLASYAHLLADDPEFAGRARQFSALVRDVSQQLAATGVRAVEVGDEVGGGRVATYDASCHLLHGQRAADEPLRMVAADASLRFSPLEGSDVCCGGAGVYNLLEPELSARVLSEKLSRVRETGATTLATGNPGCHMQIGAGARLSGLPLRVCHPVELLDAAYRRAGFYEQRREE